MRWFRRKVAPIPAPEPRTDWLTPPPPPLRWSGGALDALRGKSQPESPFVGLPTPPPGVRPQNDPPRKMAMDDAGGTIGVFAGGFGNWATGGLWGEGLFFPGYPYLAELAQRPEYRNIVETLAEEMCRKWLELKTSGDEDKGDKIRQLDDAMKRFGLREAVRRGIELDGFMGMGMIYIDLAGPGGGLVSDDPDELRSPLILEKIEKGSLRGFIPIDPTWVSPKNYNSIDALKGDYLKPTTWYVIGKEVHESRLLIIRSREVPDILKPGYNFGGLSLSQLSKPYVDNWIRTRQSVSDLLHAFTTWVLKTNLSALSQNAAALLDRITAFMWGRDNKGLMMVDKDTEELDNVSAPLSSLDLLQAQAQEQMAFPAQEPILKFVGYTPTGLGDTGETIIRSWYDRVHAKQEASLGHQIATALQVIQQSEFGKVDPEIEYDFVHLWELDEAGRAAVDKTRADADSVRIADGVIDNEEARDRLKSDPDSPYHGLAGPAPEPPDAMESTGGQEDDADRVDRGGAEGSESGANSGV